MLSSVCCGNDELCCGNGIDEGGMVIESMVYR
jgi:hypothetical protein